MLLLAAPAASPRGTQDPAERPDREPFFATFSICAVEPDTGVAGVAVTTRVPMVGAVVPWARGGVGAVATQALTRREWGPEALELLAGGLTAEETVRRLVEADPVRDRRQLGVVDRQGRAFAHTGSANGAHAGSRQGPGFTVQGNLLVSQATVDAVAEAFLGSAGSGRDLGDRLIEALAAGQRAGGDRRKGLAQSAALVVSDSRRSGAFRESLTIRVDEHAEPVAELRRIYPG